MLVVGYVAQVKHQRVQSSPPAMSSNPNREEAIADLIAALHRQYPTAGFLIHKSLKFVQDDIGIDVRNTTDLKTGEILMTVPATSRFSLANIPTADDCNCDSSLNGNSGGAVPCVAVQLRHLLDEIEVKCERVLEAISEEHEYQMDSKEVALAMLALYVRCEADRRRSKAVETKIDACANASGSCEDVNAATSNNAELFPGNTTVKSQAWLEQSLTWPSLEEMKRDVPLCWEEDVRDVLGKCFARDHMESNEIQLQAVFDGAVLPILQEELGEEPETDQEQGPSSISSRVRQLQISDFILPVVKEQGLASQRKELWQSVRYAYSIVYSRAHESVDETPELIPLVDLCNGLSDVCKGGAINVDFVSGKWPFIRGNSYGNTCNLDCSALFTECDVKAGTSLIISYGCLTTSSFFVKYGTVPLDHLRHANMTDNINIWFPPHSIPDDSTSIGKLRCIALEKGGYPLEAFRHGTIRLLFLPGDDDSSGNNPLAWYVSGEQLGVLETLQRIIILIHVADEAALQRYIVTGNIRCSLDGNLLFRMMVEVLDYNLEILSSTSRTRSDSCDVQDQSISASKRDVEHSKESELSPPFRAAYLARVCQRETLAKWRHAFCRRFMKPSHADNRRGAAGAAEINVPEELDCSACRVCGRTYPNSVCSRCKWRGEEAASYCCRAHQSSDWRTHKRECKKEHK